MNTLEILQAGRKLISDPQRWTQGSYARDSEGYREPYGSVRATCWCSVGALNKVSDETYERGEAYKTLENAVKTLTGFKCVVTDYNDTHTHAEVLAVWDEAIENASLKGEN